MARDAANLALARQIWDATAKGDPTALGEILSDEVVWITHGENPVAGRFEGRCAVIEYLAQIGDLVDDLRSELKEIYAAPSGAVLFYHVLARRGPKLLDMDFFLRIRTEEHRVSLIDSVPVDQGPTDEFWKWSH